MICITAMKRLLHRALLLSLAAASTTIATAQQGRGPQNPLMLQDTQTLPLWQGQAPGAQGTEDRDIPTITVYMPRTATPGMTAVIVCPGGGYGALAMNHEGRQVANYLNSL